MSGLDNGPDGIRWDHPAAAHVTIVDRARGLVDVVPKRKRCAIIGFASSSRLKAPFDDPSWEVWGLNQLNRYIPRADRWFEVHNRPMFEADTVRDTDYVGWLRQCPVPLYTVEEFPDMPTSIRYPFEAMTARFGVSFTKDNIESEPQPYWMSSPAYMLALAIAEGFEHVGIWGIDLIVGHEYEYEKPNMEYMIGFARGLGLTITLPVETALCKGPFIYGRTTAPDPGPISKPTLESRRRALFERRGQLVTELNAVDGGLQENAHWLSVVDLTSKGGTVLPATSTQV